MPYMEFNADGSLKIGGVAKQKANRLTITIQKTDTGKVLLVELVDTKLPYNLIEGHFHQVNDTINEQCDAHLGKKSETSYDVVITGEGADIWIDAFCAKIKDFVDGAVLISEE